MQLTAVLLPVFYIIFLWWFTTGAVIVIYGRSEPVRRVAFLIFTLALGAAVWGLVATRNSLETLHVYLAVTCGVVIWGWQTASYYLGYVTGPRPTALPPGRRHTFWQRFWTALRSSLYHELLVVACVIVLTAVTWSAPNRWGLWMFLALWLMHASAKLNVFFGVRNFRIDYLPRHLHHLDGLLSRRPVSLLLLPAVTLAPSIALALTYRALAPDASPAQTTGGLLVGVMIMLGVLEHVLLVLPLPIMLWGWGVRALPNDETQQDPSRPTCSKSTMARAMLD